MHEILVEFIQMRSFSLVIFHNKTHFSAGFGIFLVELKVLLLEN
jgi:hypothetical protein